MIRVVDSATKLDASCRDAVLVCGSHGGLYPAYLVASARCRAVILNDAGVGKDNAGIAFLHYCADLGMAAAAVDTHSARIGDANDMMRRGRISHVNAIAAGLGVRTGDGCMAAAEKLEAAPAWTTAPPAYAEARSVIEPGSGLPRIVLIDSASLVRPEDAGQIVVTGSHGGLVGGAPKMALQVDALAAAFHDAGGGVDGAGMSRLPALDARGIAAVTVAASSARIGDARSVFEEGVISHANQTAVRLGASLGMYVRDFVAAVAARARGSLPSN